jgi:O-antigen ligase
MKTIAIIAVSILLFFRSRMWLFYTWIVCAPFLQNYFARPFNNPFFGSYRLVDKYVGGQGFNIAELLEYNRFLLLAFLVSVYVAGKGSRITYKRIETPFLLFLSAVAISCLYSHSPIHTLRVLIDTFGLCYLCYFIGKNMLVDDKSINRFVVSALLLGLALSVTCFIEYAIHRHDYDEEIYRVCGPYLYWENLAISVSFLLFVCIYKKIMNTNKIMDKVYLGLIVLFAVANFLTQTRTIMAGVILGVFCIAVVGREFMSRSLMIKLCGVFLLIIVALTVNYKSLFNSNFYQKTLTRRTDVGRTEWYFVALRVIERHPVLGIGFRNFENDKMDYVTPQEIQTKWVTEKGFLHNSYLAIWSESGIMALLPMLLLLLAIFRTSYACYSCSSDKSTRAWGVCMMAMAVVYVVSATSFDPWFEPTMDNKIFFLCLGVTVRKIHLSQTLPPAV